ncbi:DUF427 domain-containing protein [Aeromicrobium sp.]
MLPIDASEGSCPRTRTALRSDVSPSTAPAAAGAGWFPCSHLVISSRWSFHGHATDDSRKFVTTYQATFHGQVVARSDETVVVEGNRYFPPDSVESKFIQRSWMKSLCYWKGVASYYDLDTGAASERHAAWTYLHPSPFARRIRGYIAFWPGSVIVEAV